MSIDLKNRIWIALFISLFPSLIKADSLNYNTFNNHGVVGLINTPTARLYNEGSFGITVYDGTPDQKLTITSSPYDWLEASFFYTSIQNFPYPGFEYQSYKDKGFNLKVRVKEEGVFPAIAIGINDIAGTGYYGSEYIVGSYGINKLDMHFGIGWGALNGSDKQFKNPLIYLADSFADRVDYYDYTDESKKGGGSFQTGRYFSDSTVSPFYGIAYSANKNILLKIEHDPTLTSGLIDYKESNNKTTMSIEYSPNKNFTIGLSKERNSFYSLKFIYKKDASAGSEPYKYKKVSRNKTDNDYKHLIKSLRANGIGVNKIIETADSLGIELTQFTHPNLDIVEEILYSAKKDSGITKDIKTEYKITDLQASSNFDDDYIKNAKTIYERKRTRNFSTASKFTIRPFLASREEFFKLAILVENNSEYIIQDNFFFSTNLKYTIKDNFDDLRFSPQDTFPAQVRSDVKRYLKKFENRIIIGRAQFDYHLTPKKNHHIMLSAGILEEMFNGYGLEYLYFDNKNNYAVGFEIFDVKKRDYNLRFGTLDYKNTVANVNLYYRNYNFIPFDAKISYGEYLAGDLGATIELSRSFLNGAKFGVFASFTDVTSEQFGEGSFDKGVFFNIPIYKNFVDYTWRPLTKDPGAKLNRKHTLHDLLIKFKPHNP